MSELLTMTSQHRRDFTATMICEHCLHIVKDQQGYDDHCFHNEVIPNKARCPKCEKDGTAGDLPPVAELVPRGQCKMSVTTLN